MVIYGTGSYTIQRFTPNDLGLFNSNFEGYEFSILKRYAHLYWIPIFPLETLFTVSKIGTSEKYEVSDPNLKTMMEAYRIPFWKHLGGFALPLIAILGCIFYNVSSNLEQKRAESSYQAKLLETKQSMADTAAYRPSANQLISLVNCLKASDVGKAQAVAKIDTSSQKIISLMLKCLSAKRDTSIQYTKENTFICSIIPSKINYTEDDQAEDDIIAHYREWFDSNNLDNGKILRWYYSGFTENTANVDAYQVDYMKSTNAHLAQFKYVVKANTIGYASPLFDSKNQAFNAGYVLTKVSVYEIGTNKPIFSDRDGVPKYKLSEIGDERRNGYHWLGYWPQVLIDQQYPAWKAKIGK